MKVVVANLNELFSLIEKEVVRAEELDGALKESKKENDPSIAVKAIMDLLAPTNGYTGTLGAVRASLVRFALQNGFKKYQPFWHDYSEVEKAGSIYKYSLYERVLDYCTGILD